MRIKPICKDCGKQFDDQRHKRCAWCRRKRPCPKCGGWRWDIAKVCKKCQVYAAGESSPHWKGGKEVYSYDLCECGKKKSKYSKRCIACYHGGVGRKHRHITTGGYVQVYKPEHPNATKAGWIMEHKFVVSEHLKRPLYKDENVHHKNGDKQDNRLSNLELWSVSQPPGQRVKDKIAWAEEILEKYKAIRADAETWLP